MLSCLFSQPYGHLLGKGWPLGSLVCDVFLCFVAFFLCFLFLSCGVLGQVWYLIVSVPDLCLLPYLQMHTTSYNGSNKRNQQNQRLRKDSNRGTKCEMLPSRSQHQSWKSSKCTWRSLIYVCMAGWMDGWLDGWLAGWMAGWMDGWLDGWLAGLMEGRPTERTDRRIDRYIYRSIDISINR